MVAFRFAPLVAGICLTFTLTGDGGADRDKDELQGVWLATAAEISGKPVPREKLKDTCFTFEGNKVLARDHTFGERAVEGSFKADRKKSPKQIDMDLIKLDGIWPGIYELKGDELRICYLTFGNPKERPTAFTTQGKPWVLIVFKRRDDATNEAEKLFRAMEMGLTKAKTLACVFDVKIDTLSYKGSLILAEGNRARLEINEATKDRPMRVQMVSDGTRLSYQDNGMPNAKIEDTPKNLHAEILTWVARTGVFLPQAPLPDVKADDAKDRFRVSGFRLGDKEKVGELDTQRLDYQLAVKGLNDPLSIALWLDVKTGLPVKRMVTEGVAGGKLRVTETYGKLTFDEKLDARKFDLPK